MEKLLVYMSNHYYIFLIITAVIVISLVGYMVDDKKENIDSHLKEAPIQKEEEENKKVSY